MINNQHSNLPTLVKANILEAISNYEINQLEDSGFFSHYDEINADCHKILDNLHKITGKNSRHIYSKDKILELAKEDVTGRISARKQYFQPKTENNISQVIAAAYTEHIIRQIDKWKKELLKISAIERNTITLNCIHNISLTIDFNSQQKPKSNMKEILADFIDKELLDSHDYAKYIDSKILIVDIKTYVPAENYNLSPFAESVRKLTGIYEAYTYSINDNSLCTLDKLINSCIRRCESDFFNNGYLQDIIRSITSELVKKLNS